MAGRVKTTLLLAGFFTGLFPAAAPVSQAGEWALSENGKHWMYYTSPSDPVEDEWIEENGRIYYVDSRGYMKTGWVRRDSDGKRYYMGEDGAMRFNTFAPDGRYVGPDGSELSGYDDYRKKAKKILKDAPDYAAGILAGFLMQDLNDDGYPDLVLTDGTEAGAQPLLIAVWDPETKEFVDSARFEPGDGSRRVSLYLGDEWYDTMLEIVWAEGDVQVFRLEDRVFETEWNLTTRPDSWGTRELLMDGAALTKSEWERARRAALSEEKGERPAAYLPADEGTVNASVDRVLTADEADLWRE